MNDKEAILEIVKTVDMMQDQIIELHGNIERVDEYTDYLRDKISDLQEQLNNRGE